MFKTLSENLYGIQNIIAALIAGLIAWRYNSVASKLNREQFSRQLIKDFEDRYMILRKKLIEVEDAEREQDLNGEESAAEVVAETLFDPTSKTHPFVHTFEEYLALCSSQYYWWKRHYIDEELWKKSAYGMNQWYESSCSFQAYLNATVSKAYDEEFIKVLKGNK